MCSYKINYSLAKQSFAKHGRPQVAPTERGSGKYFPRIQIAVAAKIAKKFVERVSEANKVSNFRDL